jgi:hypothetical protein
MLEEREYCFGANGATVGKEWDVTSGKVISKSAANRGQGMAGGLNAPGGRSDGEGLEASVVGACVQEAGQKSRCEDDNQKSRGEYVVSHVALLFGSSRA